jgi:hypothetical protein
MRPKGIPNKRTKEICDLIDQSRLGPAEALLAILNLDYKALGRDSATRTRWTSAGIEYEEEVISLESQLDAAKQLMKYRYSQKQAVEVSTGEAGIKIIVEDYSKK